MMALQNHWHVDDQGMRHVHIKPRTPQLNGKVEWEHFYNFSRPHRAFDGKFPYEALRDPIQ